VITFMIRSLLPTLDFFSRFGTGWSHMYHAQQDKYR
jgi:hypothetical protein